MSDLKITAVHTFVTQPASVHCRLIVVKVLTSEPGLFGLGCATYSQRYLAVKSMLDNYLGPFVVGKDPRNIEDIWQSAMVNGYWRNGPVANNALGGIDEALWDIKGKLAGVPCYQLWGGKSREAAAVYVHADGREPQQVADNVRKYMEQGFRFIRCQMGGYAGLEGSLARKPENAPPGTYFDPKEKLRRIPGMFEHIRKDVGDEVELLHDVHERLAPSDAVWFAKALEPYRLFYLEDILAPEDLDWLEQLRHVCATPIAIGELFCHPREYNPIILRRLIDFIRVHVTGIGGITPALKLAHLADACGVRTAWHGPGDVSPIGVAANVQLDVNLHNFGIQEWCFRNQAEQDIFPGQPQIRDGYAYLSDKPGLGVEFNEEIAAKFPPQEGNPEWTVSRLPDGTMWRP